MTESHITPEGVERIQAAREEYVTALSTWNQLRCQKPRRHGQPDYIASLADAHRRVKEAIAEFVMLFEHETGRKLHVPM